MPVAGDTRELTHIVANLEPGQIAERRVIAKAGPPCARRFGVEREGAGVLEEWPPVEVKIEIVADQVCGLDEIGDARHPVMRSLGPAAIGPRPRRIKRG